MNVTVRGRPAADGPGADGTVARGAGGVASDTRLRLYRNPLRLVVSASPWRAACYLAGYVFVTGWVLFSVTFAATVTAAVLAITLAGIPLLVAAAGVLRGCASVERVRLRQVLCRPVGGGYRPVSRPGVVAQLKTRWRDPATWRDVAYLTGFWVPLFILDTVVLSVWLTFLAGVTLPVWYWAPRGNAGIGYTSETTIHGVTLGYFPHGPQGTARRRRLPRPVPDLQLRPGDHGPRARGRRALSAPGPDRPAGRGQGGARGPRAAGPAERPHAERGPPGRSSHLTGRW